MAPTPNEILHTRAVMEVEPREEPQTDTTAQQPSELQKDPDRPYTCADDGIREEPTEELLWECQTAD